MIASSLAARTRQWHQVGTLVKQSLPESNVPVVRTLEATLRSIAVVTIDDVRSLTLSLPRTTEAFVHGRVKFRVGQIVYVSFSRDETVMGFAFPKEEREWLVGTEPEKFLMPRESDLRFNWVLVRLAAIDIPEMRERVFDAWRMVVPKFLAAEQELLE